MARCKLLPLAVLLVLHAAFGDMDSNIFFNGVYKNTIDSHPISSSSEFEDSISNNLFLEHAVFSRQAQPFSAPKYLPPKEYITCSTEQQCVKKNVCQGGFFTDNPNGFIQNCEPETDVCCTYRPPPTTTQRPSVPCAGDSDCVEPSQCTRGTINVSNYAKTSSASQCYAPEVCCRLPATALTPDGYVLTVPEVPFPQPPTSRPVTYKPSVPRQPTYQTPATKPSTYQTPGSKPPAYVPPQPSQPSYQPTTRPTYQTPGPKQPSYSPPTQPAVPSYQPSIKPSYQPPVPQQPTYGPPVTQAPTYIPPSPPVTPLRPSYQPPTPTSYQPTRPQYIAPSPSSPPVFKPPTYIPPASPSPPSYQPPTPQVPQTPRPQQPRPQPPSVQPIRPQPTPYRPQPQVPKPHSKPTPGYLPPKQPEEPYQPNLEGSPSNTVPQHPQPEYPQPEHPQPQRPQPQPQRPQPQRPQPQQPQPQQPQPQYPQPQPQRPQPQRPQPQQPQPQEPQPQYPQPQQPQPQYPQPQEPQPQRPQPQPQRPQPQRPQPLQPQRPQPQRPQPQPQRPQPQRPQPQRPQPQPQRPQPQPHTKPTPGYLPPTKPVEPVQPNLVGSPSNRVPLRGEAILSEPIYPSRRPPVFENNVSPFVPQKCAAALICTDINYCDSQGTITSSPANLSPLQNAFRAPLTDCTIEGSGAEGKCCRDSNYVDPWPVNPTGQCATRNKNTKPQGVTEEDTSFAEIPWQTMILKESTKTLLCGGAIIGYGMVLTTADCLAGEPTKDVLVKAGEWQLGIDDEPLPFQLVRASEIEIHPEYDAATGQNNLAIILLEKNLQTAIHINPICISDKDPSPSERCIVTGWGKEALKIHQQGALMHQTPAEAVSRSECGASPSQVCARTKYDACHVDYGSALACGTGDSYTLKGIFTSEDQCGNSIATFAKPDIKWINTAFNSNSRALTLG